MPVEALARLPESVVICEDTEVVGAHRVEGGGDSAAEAHWHLDLLDGECMQADIVRRAEPRALLQRRAPLRSGRGSGSGLVQVWLATGTIIDLSLDPLFANV